MTREPGLCFRGVFPPICMRDILLKSESKIRPKFARIAMSFHKLAYTNTKAPLKPRSGVDFFYKLLFRESPFPDLVAEVYACEIWLSVLTACVNLLGSSRHSSYSAVIPEWF